MFRSKGFTTAFIFLSILIIGLGGVLIYLLTGNGIEALEQLPIAQTETAATSAAQTQAAETTAETETETAAQETEKETKAETTASAEKLDHARPLTLEEDHNFPVLGEELVCTGTLTIIRSGDNGEGLTFHMYPQFDAAESPGNATFYSGEFRIVAKVYVEDNGRPYLMYKTDVDANGKQYYVTSNPTYIQFTADKEPTVPVDSSKVISYGYGQEKGFVATVFQDDGNTLSFSVSNYVDGVSSPILENCLAVYDADGTANFDFMNSDGKICTGTVSFETPQDDAFTSKIIRIRFSKPVVTSKGEKSSIGLRN